MSRTALFISPHARVTRSPGVAEGETSEKTCRGCGKELAGHRRYKDAKGYLCRECHETDKKRRVPCAECGKPTAPELLRPWGPTTICPKCYVDHERDPKQRVNRKVSTRHFDRENRVRTFTYAGVLATLIVVLLVSRVAC